MGRWRLERALLKAPWAFFVGVPVIVNRKISEQQCIVFSSCIFWIFDSSSAILLKLVIVIVDVASVTCAARFPLLPPIHSRARKSDKIDFHHAVEPDPPPSCCSSRDVTQSSQSRSFWREGGLTAEVVKPPTRRLSSQSPCELCPSSDAS